MLLRLRRGTLWHRSVLARKFFLRVGDFRERGGVEVAGVLFRAGSGGISLVGSRGGIGSVLIGSVGGRRIRSIQFLRNTRRTSLYSTILSSNCPLTHRDIVDDLRCYFLTDVGLRGGCGAAFGGLVLVCYALFCGGDLGDEV